MIFKFEQVTEVMFLVTMLRNASPLHILKLHYGIQAKALLTLNFDLHFLTGTQSIQSTIISGLNLSL